VQEDDRPETPPISPDQEISTYRPAARLEAPRGEGRLIIHRHVAIAKIVQKRQP
jgi:hypothetical protein